jgi:Uma2 family endonuclease
MDWAEVVAHPSLQDLPFKIETNEFGQIVMNPVKINHSIYQSKISNLLQNMGTDGLTLTECAVETRRGTKCADVAWASNKILEIIGGKTQADIAPEICVEVVSISNSPREMKQKRKLYFEQGAKEVWLCDENGNMQFFDEEGELTKSIWFPDFPSNISYK